METYTNGLSILSVRLPTFSRRLSQDSKGQLPTKVFSPVPKPLSHYTPVYPVGPGLMQVGKCRPQEYLEKGGVVFHNNM